MIRRNPWLFSGMLYALLLIASPAQAHDINQSGIRILYRSHDVVVTVTTALSRLTTAEGGGAAAMLDTPEALDRAIRRRLQLQCDGQFRTWPKANIITDRAGDLLCWQTVIAGPDHQINATGPLYPEDPGSHTTLTLLRDGQAVEETVLNAPQSTLRRNPGAIQTVGGMQAAFTRSIATRQLTPTLALIALGVAFLFGALHALSPGHGKTMVAAALVGTRGTARHAVFLGLVVTLTHTIGVFTLGLLTLSAAQTVVPERLYPILSILSGGMIVCVGASLLGRQIRIGQKERTGGGWDDEGEGSVAPPLPSETKFSLRSLLVLGVTGGAIPCPSALVVMLSAMAMHRIAFGLVLILAFSLGLAVVLTGIGLMVVRLGTAVERRSWNPKLVAHLPIVSATTILFTGVLFMVRAFRGL